MPTSIGTIYQYMRLSPLALTEPCSLLYSKWYNISSEYYLKKKTHWFYSEHYWRETKCLGYYLNAFEKSSVECKL